MSGVPVDPTREEAELADYLGAAFDRARLERWGQVLDDEAGRIGDEATLYRTSEAYLYNLTAFAMTPTKAPYRAALTSLVAPPARLLDYGCGIGSDGLALLEHGYRVEFSDFDNPSVRYLRWRLERRGATARIHDLDGEVPGGFDLAYAFDVIEHVPDPVAFLSELERRARIVLVNLLEDDPSDTDLHRSLPIRAVLRRAARRGILHYSRHHDGRSHLVAYRSRLGGPLAVGRSVAALIAGGRRGRG